MLEVIVSTYNQPAWLDKVLWGYAGQTYRDYCLTVADDGSGSETSEVIEHFEREAGFPVRHHWHPDEGYRRQKILNEAIRASEASYLIFTDGDCIPAQDFIAIHAQLAKPGRFLSGGYCKLPMQLSRKITRKDVTSGRCFDVRWLYARGLRGRSQRLKLASRGIWSILTDLLTTTRATWNNCNASGWRTDILRVNGFDERMQYGGADRELGARLENAGVRGRQIRNRAVCLHLDHDRGYANPDSIRKNQAIRRETAQSRSTWTAHGIRKGIDQPASVA